MIMPPMAVDPPALLPSWRESPARAAILDFLFRVTWRHSPEYLPAEERIAVFDCDGTLWCERPRTVEGHFVDSRLRRLVPRLPGWKSSTPGRSTLVGTWEKVNALGPRAVAELMMATHVGLSTEEFVASVRDWLSTTMHPDRGVPYTHCVYQPMGELLWLLREQGFTSYLVSGGSVEFTRVFAAEALGFPPERVIGSTIRTHFEMRDGVPRLVRDPVVDLFDDRSAKAAVIERSIGRRPVLCVGNSDGDREMLLWTTCRRADGRLALGVVVHHTDGEREFEYDSETIPTGHLSHGLKEAEDRGWKVVDMRRDWSSIFPGNVNDESIVRADWRLDFDPPRERGQQPGLDPDLDPKQSLPE